MAASGASDRGAAKLATERPVSESRIERDGLKPGVQAPLFTLPDLDGRRESLVAYRGQRVLLVFSDPRCGPCNDVAPELVRLHAHNPALQIVMVSRGELGENRTKAQEHGFAFPVVLQDGWKLSKEYGIFATPVAFLIDEEGTIAKPVAIGADAIVAIASTTGPGDRRSKPQLPALAEVTLSRWRAITQVAAGFVTALFMNPSRVVAAACTSSANCSAGQSCVAGVCQGSATCASSANCPAGQTCIAGTCQVTSVSCSSNANCPAGHSCVGGLCQSACPTGTTRCAGGPGPGACVNVQTSAANCGGCGNVCASGQTCVNGVCKGSGICTTSANCPTGQVCVAGVCRLPCRNAGLTMCNGTCVDLQNDAANCGACGVVCPGGKVCTNGACVSVVCPPSATTVCGKKCVNLKIDPSNCGACGKQCPRGTYCIGGKCLTRHTGMLGMWRKLRGIFPGATAV
jgi:peroxiredoxin